jgi:hypothetical protein
VPQNKQKAHKVLNYKKAQCDQIEKDFTETYKQLKKDQASLRRGAMPVFSFFWLFM